MFDRRYGDTEELSYAYPPDDRRRHRDGYRDREARARTVRVTTTVATILTSVFAAILGLQIIFTLLGANTANPLVTLVADLSFTLAWFFHDLFTPDFPQLRMLLNYGLAALFWLGIGQGISVLVRSLR